MCRLTWSSSSLAVLTRGPRSQRLQPNHVIFVSKSSRRINYTQETAEPLGVSPPEAVDLLLIKNPLAPASWCAGSAIKRPCEPVPVTHAPEGHRPDAKRRVHRSAARLPARPRPAPLVATNSSPGV